MASTRTFQRAFVGGELSPEMFGRLDDAKYQNGLALCRNFIVTPHGPVHNRAGFMYVRHAKHTDTPVRLIAFTYSTTQTMVIEAGAGYFRFHTQGQTLMNGAVPYEIASPFAASDLFELHTVQSADVLTLVHPNHAPRELRRLGALDWQLSTIAFTPQLAAPPAPTLTKAGQTENQYTYEYVVTALDADGRTESAASPKAAITGNLYQTGASITLSWAAVAGASRYNVYKLQGGLFGYIGQTETLSMVDDNIGPDLSTTPPRFDDVFNGAGKYPSAVSYFEQRRAFAGTINQPQNIWLTKSGTETNMSYSLPVRDDDRISFRVAAREANTIRHIVPLNELLLLTSSAEWRVTSLNNDALTPASISVRPQSYVGASVVQPVIINNTLIYAAARGGHVREMAYNWQAGGFLSGDLSLRSPHLFDNFEIADMAAARAPQPIVWFVSTSGKLLGLTYVPEQQIGAWHQHNTGPAQSPGAFESCCVVAEGREDVLYVVVRRELGGQTVRTIERMVSRQFEDARDAFFVDCGATYDGAPATVIQGLSWLEGQTVNILADGAVQPQQVVTNASITLDHAARLVHVGLPIEADLHTLPLALALADGSFGQGRAKNVNKIWLRVWHSAGVWAGPDAAHLTEYKPRSTEPYGSPPALKSGEIPLVLPANWQQSGQIHIAQRDPLALTVVSLTAEFVLGG